MINPTTLQAINGLYARLLYQRSLKPTAGRRTRMTYMEAHLRSLGMDPGAQALLQAPQPASPDAA